MFHYKAGSEDGKTHASIFVLRQRNPRSHRQNMRLGSRFVLVVETHGAIWTKVISVSRFRRMAALDPVHSASRYHFTLSIYYQINFFRLFMMVRKVRTSRRKIHPKQADHDICLVDGITRSGPRTCEQ